MVGSANGRSMSALTALFPWNSSRTSTQATSVPATAFTTTTRSDAPNVSVSAATAEGDVTSSQNAPSPPSSDAATTAAIGSRTIRPRYAVESPSARPPARPVLRPVRAGSRRASGLPVSRDSQLGLDVGEDALLPVEEPRPHVVPAAEVGDGEEAGRLRVFELAEDLLDDGAVALLAEDALRLGRAEVVDERLRPPGLGRVGRDRDRVLDQDRLVRDDVLERPVGLLGEDRLVLVRKQDVALPGEERLQRLARALVLDRNVLEEELAQVLDPLLLGCPLFELGAVGGHDVPLRAARGERVRRDHLDAFAHEVVPRPDVLGITLADDEDDDRLGHHAVVLVFRPVRGDESRVDEPRDVGLERERDHVRVEARLDRPALLARGRVGLLEVDARTGRSLLEGRDDLLVGLARRRVGDEREGAAASGGAGGVAAAAAGGRDCEDEDYERREGEGSGGASVAACHWIETPLSRRVEWGWYSTPIGVSKSSTE